MSRRYAYILYFNVQKALYIVLTCKQEMAILKICGGGVKGFHDEFSYQILRASMLENLHIVGDHRCRAVCKKEMTYGQQVQRRVPPTPPLVWAKVTTKKTSPWGEAPTGSTDGIETLVI